MNIIKWIKRNWQDPVWSKVFASGIIFILANFYLLLKSIYKSISIQDSYNQALRFLYSTKYEISLFAIVIIVLSIIILIFTPVIIAISRTKKHVSFLHGKPTNWVEIVDGEWTNEYRDPSGGMGTEPLKIKNGTEYSINGRLIFRLTEIVYDDRARMIKWAKLRVSNNRVHSIEYLNILGQDSLEGLDSLGCTIRYHRTK